MKVLMSAHMKWYNAEAEYVHRLARGMVKRGHRVVVWTRDGSPLTDRLKADNVATEEFGDPGSLNPAVLSPSLKFLDKLLRQEEFDLVDAHRSEGFPLIALAARRRGVKVVRTRADMRPPRLAAINRYVYGSLPDLLITANDLLRDNLLVGLKLDPRKVVTVRMGLDPAEFDGLIGKEQAKEKIGAAGSPVVAIMGRLGPVKGHEFFLKAAAKVADRIPEVRFLVLYRDVEQSDVLLPALEKSPIKDRFILVGPREGHKEVMRAADVAAIPSVGSEAHCRVALEWMALSVPVIGSRVGVIPEIVGHGDTGFLVQPRYADTIAQCMLQLLENPALATKMGEAGRARLLAEFTEDAMVEKSLAALEGLL